MTALTLTRIVTPKLAQPGPLFTVNSAVRQVNRRGCQAERKPAIDRLIAALYRVVDGENRN